MSFKEKKRRDISAISILHWFSDEGIKTSEIFSDFIYLDMKGNNQSFLFYSLFSLMNWSGYMFAPEFRQLQSVSKRKQSNLHIISLSWPFIFLLAWPFVYFGLAFGPQHYFKENNKKTTHLWARVLFEDCSLKLSNWHF